jgi:outer membrane beta-barrel protein
MTRILVPPCLVGGLVIAAATAGAPRAIAAPSPFDEPGACVDPAVKADLDAKRRRRLVKDRLVQKTNRHELGVRGGHYVSDLFDAAPVLAASYGYHLTEDFAVEASGAWTRITSAGGPELEQTFAVLGGRDRKALLFAANLVYSPFHAKLQTGASIVHFDVFFTAGAGVVDSALSSGVAANGGIGFLFFAGRALGIRLDLRDYVYRQQLLAEKAIVNDIAATVGISMLLPFAE